MVGEGICPERNILAGIKPRPGRKSLYEISP
jgi:hypothetical protein